VAVDAVQIPVATVLKLIPPTALSVEGAGLLVNPSASAAVVPLPQDDVVRQLSSGVVQFPFSMLQQLIPTNLLQPPGHLSALGDPMIRFPLGEVVRRVPQRLLSKRGGQQTLGSDYQTLDAPFVPQRPMPGAQVPPPGRPASPQVAIPTPAVPAPTAPAGDLGRLAAGATPADVGRAFAGAQQPVTNASRAQQLAERLREREQQMRSEAAAPAPVPMPVPAAPAPAPAVPVAAAAPEPAPVSAPAPAVPAGPTSAPVRALPEPPMPEEVLKPTAARKAMARWLGVAGTLVGIKEMPELLLNNPHVRGVVLVDGEGLALSSSLPSNLPESSLSALASRIFGLLGESSREMGMEPRDQVLATFGTHTLLITQSKPFLLVTLHPSPDVPASLQRRLRRLAKALATAESE
jgi:predicted regulator of Ras-like GTPase activity (Roadblock/LC7/MglB family)